MIEIQRDTFTRLVNQVVAHKIKVWEEMKQAEHMVKYFDGNEWWLQHLRNKVDEIDRLLEKARCEQDKYDCPELEDCGH